MANDSPFKKIILSRYTLAAIVFAFFLTSLIVEVQRTKRTCKVTVKTDTSKTVYNCDSEFIQLMCSYPALDIRRVGSGTDSNGKTTTADMRVFCPWRVRTSIVTYISMGVATVFLILFTRPLKKISPIFGIIFGVFAAISTLALVVLMAIDVSDGYKLAKAIYEGLSDKSFQYSHSIFIADVVVSGIAFLLIIVLTVVTIKDRNAKPSSSETSVVRIIAQTEGNSRGENYSAHNMTSQPGQIIDQTNIQFNISTTR